ncbi:MAG: hypothetical protein KatS3mg062_0633 [Tepidiforma sp.]|nr:MAG: hypothetical protein KatS3mg062_0633 [Tepidiforma sp.]
MDTRSTVMVGGRFGWPRLAVRDWLAVAAAVGLAGSLLYLAGFEQGAVALFDGTLVHEFVHDARHALGFPCH